MMAVTNPTVGSHRCVHTMAQQEPTIGVFFANMLTVYYHARFDQTSASKFVRYVHELRLCPLR